MDAQSHKNYLFLIKSSLVDYHSCCLLCVYCKLFSSDAVIASLFLMFQKVSIPDSGFHLMFPLDFWKSWSFLSYTISLK